MKNEKTAADYNGVCPVCGSIDGMIIHGKDGKYRIMCRVMGCPARYKPCPVIGFDTEEDCRNPRKHPFAITCRKCGSNRVKVIAFEYRDLEIRCKSCGASVNCGVYDTEDGDYSEDEA